MTKKSDQQEIMQKELFMMIMLMIIIGTGTNWYLSTTHLYQFTCAYPLLSDFCLGIEMKMLKRIDECKGMNSSNIHGHELVQE